jgi:preprotein translocase subunit SecB
MREETAQYLERCILSLLETWSIANPNILYPFVNIDTVSEDVYEIGILIHVSATKKENTENV